MRRLEMKKEERERRGLQSEGAAAPVVEVPVERAGGAAAVLVGCGLVVQTWQLEKRGIA